MKYFFKENNKEVKIGDEVGFKHKEVHGNESLEISFRTTLTEDNLKTFIKHGLIREEEDYTLGFFYTKLAERLNITLNNMMQLAEKLKRSMPSILFQMLLKEISLEFGKGVNFREAPFVYAISLINGEFITVTTFEVKNFANFAVFKSPKDAMKAKKLLKPILRLMF